MSKLKVKKHFTTDDAQATQAWPAIQAALIQEVKEQRELYERPIRFAQTKGRESEYIGMLRAFDIVLDILDSTFVKEKE